MLLLQAALGFPRPVAPRFWDRPGLLGAALVESALGLAQPPAPALRRRELGGQLVTARVSEALVLLGVDGVGLLENLARDLLVITCRLRRRVGMDLRAVDRDHANPHQARLGAQRQHVDEQLSLDPPGRTAGSVRW